MANGPYLQNAINWNRDRSRSLLVEAERLEDKAREMRAEAAALSKAADWLESPLSVCLPSEAASPPV